MRSRDVYSAITVRLLSGLIHLLRWIPRRMALAVGRQLGNLLYILARAKRNCAVKKRYCFIDLSLNRALDDLAQALGPDKPPRELKALARGSFQNAGRSMIESLRIPQLQQSEMLDLIDADSFDPVHRVLDRGKGLLILTPHLGVWELLASYLVMRLDQPFNAIVQRQRYSPYNELIHKIRFDGAGVNVIYQDSGPRPILTALRKNQSVGILGDLYMPKLHGTYVQFFGRPAYTPLGPAALARSTGAGMVPIFIRWKEESGSGAPALRHHVHILPEVDLVRTRDRNADVLENTQRWTRVIEGVIRKYPQQWIWFHRRWATEKNDGCPDRLHPSPYVKSAGS